MNIMKYKEYINTIVLMVALMVGMPLTAEARAHKARAHKTSDENDDKAMTVSRDDYFVESWQYNAQVHKDNSWDITEMITVNFVQPHHGIYIYRPTLFSDNHLYKGEMRPYMYKIRCSDVSVEGQPFESYDNDDSQESLVVKIGDPEKTLTGRHTYSITYRMVYPDDRIDTHDVLYHSVMGDGWPSDIDTLSFNVNFDKPLPKVALDSCKVRSGTWSSEEDNLNICSRCWVSSHGFGGTIIGLKGGNAITFYSILPEGFYEDEFVVTDKNAMKSWYMAFTIAVITLCVFMMRRPKRPVDVLEFYPPEGISSAEVGTIIDEQPDVSDLTSLIPWFAAHGYIKIKDIREEDAAEGKKSSKKKKNADSTDVELTMVKRLPKDAPQYQQTFFNKVLFKNGTTVLISDLGDCHKGVADAQKQLAKVFSGERKLARLSWMGLLYVVMIFGLCTTIVMNSSVYAGYDDGCINAFLCGFMLFLVTIFRCATSAHRAFKGGFGKWSWVVMIIAFIFCVGMNHIFADPQNTLIAESYMVVLIAANIVSIALADRIQQDTDYRIAITGKLIGLREFIRTAEQDRLQMFVDEHPEYFYKILPYAMVFGLTDKWVKQFENITMKSPDWYDTSAHLNHLTGIMVANQLTHHLSHSISDGITVASHDPSATSSSGGGFAGGGGGGGGGGAW